MVTVPKKSGATESKMNNIKQGEEGNAKKDLEYLYLIQEKNDQGKNLIQRLFMSKCVGLCNTV